MLSRVLLPGKCVISFSCQNIGMTGRVGSFYIVLLLFAQGLRLFLATLEECTILEKISSDAYVFLQTHKRVWPASQRDALFWSHMRKINDGLEEGTHDSWVVCNNSTEREEYPVSLLFGFRKTRLIFEIFSTAKQREMYKDIPNCDLSLPNRHRKEVR